MPTPGTWVLVYHKRELVNAFKLHHNVTEGYYVIMCGKQWKVRPYPSSGSVNGVETCGLVNMTA